jgi:hypothetical protein
MKVKVWSPLVKKLLLNLKELEQRSKKEVATQLILKELTLIIQELQCK